MKIKLFNKDDFSLSEYLKYISIRANEIIIEYDCINDNYILMPRYNQNNYNTNYTSDDLFNECDEYEDDYEMTEDDYPKTYKYKFDYHYTY